MLKYLGAIFCFSICLISCTQTDQSEIQTDSSKLIIYQLPVRLFGNQNTTNQYYGSIEENGSGKFNDITGTALDSLKAFGITHIWYTGILEHATMTDYSSMGIKQDDPDVVKGRAGSPYAVKDYYDVDPDLAINVKDRMKEFEALIDRTHQHGLKLLIDFIPNHVAREYYSDVAPDSVVGFGMKDDLTKAFSPTNDFYYIPNSSFKVPEGENAGGPNFKSRLKDGKFDEKPAKATGNNVFKSAPSINDWYETIKLNYGLDVMNQDSAHFSPMPPVWKKMYDILSFWADKGVDGFRCDVAEMVPVEFWNWVIPKVKERHPNLIFLAESYTPEKYAHYISVGKFDYLYNKVGLYDALKKFITNNVEADVEEIRQVVAFQKEFQSHMLNFLENHDEERIASEIFAGDPKKAFPSMVASAAINKGPMMIYFGQEMGEEGKGKEGYGGDDGKTTIFDYWNVPAVYQWINNGKFDGGLLSEEQRNVRKFYQQLLKIVQQNKVLTVGDFEEVRNKDFGAKQFSFLRKSGDSAVWVILNFDNINRFEATISYPFHRKGMKVSNLFTGERLPDANDLKIELPPSGFLMLRFD